MARRAAGGKEGPRRPRLHAGFLLRWLRPLPPSLAQQPRALSKHGGHPHGAQGTRVATPISQDPEPYWLAQVTASFLK